MFDVKKTLFITKRAKVPSSPKGKLGCVKINWVELDGRQPVTTGWVLGPADVWLKYTIKGFNLKVEFKVAKIPSRQNLK